MLKIWLAIALWVVSAAGAQAATTWVEGKHYYRIEPARPIDITPGKVTVTEVFSYACPACNFFAPVADKLQASLPANARLDFVAASFRPDEDWPVFQRAYYTAQAMGIDKKTHRAMFDAVWKTGALAIMDASGRQVKRQMPTIEDAAAFYARAANIKAETFLATAKSFGVDLKIRQAEELIRAWQIDGTPSIVVNGKYRLDVRSAGNNEALIALVRWLVAREHR